MCVECVEILFNYFKNTLNGIKKFQKQQKLLKKPEETIKVKTKNLC